MIDSFAVLTPLLVLPLALLALMVGCTSAEIGELPPVEVTYRVRFFFAGNNLGHTYRLRVSGASEVPAVADVHTNQLQKLGGPGASIEGVYEFSDLVPPDMVTLTCEVIDLGLLPVDDGEPPPVPTTVVNPSPDCTVQLNAYAGYHVEFRAGVLPDGTPLMQFEECSVEQI